MSAALSAMFGGQPSTTQPIAGPWLSPKVVTRNSRPNVLNDMAAVGSPHTPRGQTGGALLPMPALVSAPTRRRCDPALRHQSAGYPQAAAPDERLLMLT